MESPVVVDKPPEYHGNNDRGFPFEEEEGSGAWSELAARHPDIAARLRQRPATWARKRRPSSQDATDDFGDTFSGFDRFPFDDIPPEFRDHFPSHWNRRFSREEPPPEPGPHHQPQPPSPPSTQQHTAATQTEGPQEPEQSAREQSLPQYGLRNTVDLGQKSPAEPSVDAEERGQRSMSAPPAAPRPHPDMSSPAREQAAHEPAHVRHIPIFVEGRDEPVINKNVDHGAHFGENKPTHAPPPHVDRDQYFADDAPGFHHPPNFTRAFGTPFAKNFRQGPQPFTQQKAYPQSAFARGPSPQRSQSPKPPPHHEEHFAKVPVHHEPPHAEQARQQKPAPPRQPSPQAQPPEPPREQTPPRAPPAPHDPITQILSIQTDVLNLMTEVENFKGAKRDKRYLFLDEMLTRNLIKLDNIETEGKENIRQARKEAIRCIQKCIAVLEAKADSQGSAPAPQDVNMEHAPSAPHAENGLVENVDMKEPSKEEENRDTQPKRIDEPRPKEEAKVEREATPKPQEIQSEQPAAPPAVTTEPAAADTRPEETEPEATTDEQTKQVENKSSPKKKVGKKRDKSKDKAQDSSTEASKDSDKVESGDTAIQVDDKGDKTMEVDGASQ